MTINAFSQPILRIHYNRLNSDYEGWTLWVWNQSDGKAGFELQPKGKDSFGVYYDLDMGASGLLEKKAGLLPKYKNWESKESFDRILDYKGEKEIFISEGEKDISSKLVEVSTAVDAAFFDIENTVRAVFNRKVNEDFLKNENFRLEYSGREYKPVSSRLSSGKYSKVAYLEFAELPFDYKKVNLGLFFLSSDSLKKIRVFLGKEMYNSGFYSDKEMGVSFSDGKIYFRVFSPNAVNVNLLLKDSAASDKEISFPMSDAGAGIWEYETSLNLENKFYRYEVFYADKKLYGLDPYARSVFPDEKKAIIVNDKTHVAEGPSLSPADSIIYEMSIRDFTVDEFSGVMNKGKYLGLTETRTFHSSIPGLKTGVAHLKELGINVVHIMPFQDFENNEYFDDYNWGYMPVNFNSPEGWYATKKDDSSRIREAKAMISSLHENGIRVVMDVVYNHTAETPDKVYNFNALAYGYYYRAREDGSYYDGSGCGNEFKTEALMSSKFILDSLKYWVKEYGVDGFRFDLMGLMDKDTAFKLVAELRKIKPDILIYGEPWTAGETPVKGISKGVQKGENFAVFNDNFRDALKGSVFNVNDLGYVQNGSKRSGVMEGIRGSINDFTASPLETINYVSSHDNHTLWDRLSLSLPKEEISNRIKMDKLAQAVVFVSQGIPFMLSGEEFLRTKKGEDNSYNLPDAINKIDWTRKKEYADVFSFYRDLIELRKEHKAFRMETAAAVNENLKFYEQLGLSVEKPCIAFLLYGKKAGDSSGKLLVLINPEKEKKVFALPEGKWRLIFDENGFSRNKDKFAGKTFVAPISLWVFEQ